MNDIIRFEGVSRFYGDVLGVNRVDLELEPGIIGLVGPNGAGKSTLMNLVTGARASQPGQGHGAGRGTSQYGDLLSTHRLLHAVRRFSPRHDGPPFAGQPAPRSWIRDRVGE